MSTYTDGMIQTLRDNAPLNLSKAKDLAGNLGVTYRSIISKAKQLGIEYQNVTAAKKSKGVTKGDVLNAIRTRLELPEKDGDLSKAELMLVLETLNATDND